MTDKLQKIREEVERLKSQLLRGACSSQIAMEILCKEEAYNEVLAILDTMQEEPVSEELEEEIDNYVKRNGYDGLDSIEEIKYIAQYFTKWQKEQMMAKAVDGKVIANGMGNPILHLWDKGRHLIGKKVKVIVIKED